MGLTSSLQVTSSFGPLATKKVADITISFNAARIFWGRLKHYLRIIDCQNGVYIEIKMAESN